ncbi:MAG TPA: hypothetical protein DCQ06_00645, partial [Myxococcales bacterium]|nr:hypothetical protein [Myxococcales bacterium]
MKRERVYLTLASLYIVQGLPFGFQATALPIVMRQQGASLTAIGLLSLLSLPWICKPLWAPWVDRSPFGGPGRRRNWILGSQSLLLLACLLGALVADSGDHTLLLCAVFVMNLCAATQDIAVDGLAVDLLSGGQLGPANAAQVVGYKVGMMFGGGLLVWASAWIGWSGLFIAIAVIIAAVLVHFWTCPLEEKLST